MALLKTEKLHKKTDPAALGTTGAASDPIVTRLAKEDKVPWYKKPNLRLLYFMLFPTCMGIELTSGFDSQMINALQIVPSWVSFFGNPQVPMYIIARLILGFGIPTCIVSASALIGELAYPKERPVMTSLFNVSYFPGQILAAAICFGTNNIPNDWGWRIPSLLQMCPSLLQIAFVFFIPESPRWLITKDRSEEAHKILAKYHAEGDHEAEFVKAEIAQIQATIHLEIEASKRSWLDLVATKGMRRRLLISCMLGLFTQWSGNTLISYYLSDILNMIGKTESLFKQQINVSIACWNLFNAAIIASVVTRFKRRRMYLICTISLLIVYISWTVSMERAMAALAAKEVNSAAGAATIFFIYAYYPAYNVGYNALTYTYLVELWPYMERSMGIAIFQLFGRLSGFFTTFVNPIGLANAGWKYLISYCCFLAFEIGFIFFIFPETYGRTLEELAFLFEDKALADEAVHAVEKSIAHHDDTAAIPDRPEVRIETKETLWSSYLLAFLFPHLAGPSLTQTSMAEPLAFHGTVIHSLSPSELAILESSLLIVGTDGAINTFEKEVSRAQVPGILASHGLPDKVRYLERGEFLIPGFVDTHNHAPQYAQRGLGQSMHILDWLDNVTFPNEARFKDVEYAKRIYSECVDGFIRQGITTASYYGSMHADATNILADLCLRKGQRAFVGKCNMNRNAPDFYRDATIQSSLEDTEKCIHYIRHIDPESKLLKHVLTPRFAITCDSELLEGLGRIAAQNPDLPIQTHFNEAEQEMKFTKYLFPQFKNEVDLYHSYGLLNRRSILAHCCFVSEYEMNRLKELDCGVAHCPVSNMTVGGGFMAAPIRHFLRRGIKVGLGTDSGGGFSASILDAMRQALVASNAREVMSQGQDKGLDLAEVFFLATLGGAQVCCLDEKIGSFQVGKQFDALLISSSKPGVMTMLEDWDSTRTIFDKFIMTGDDRNIELVFVNGVSVKR
ncbi:hypothetical protein SCUP234_07216 [Seiridium cupressi]